MPKNGVFAPLLILGLGVAGLLNDGLAASATTSTAPEDNSPQEATSGALEEITVTAQRRSEPLQRVPITVTAISGDSLATAQITSTEDLTFLVPGLVFQRQLTSAAPFIRGIGNRNASPGDESGVGIYVDGVYYSSLFAGIFPFNNIERVEVLEGPQGTLFGRNALGGVIQIVTPDPVSQPRIDTSITYGNFNTVQGTFYGTTGIAPNLSADIAVYYQDQGNGWGHNFTTGSEAYKGNETAFRSKLLWTPDDRTSVKLTGEYDRSYPVVPPWYRAPGGGALTGNTPYVGNFNVLENQDPDPKNHWYGGNLQVNHDFNLFSVLSISSYRNVYLNYDFDQDGTPSPLVNLFLTERASTWTQEVHFTSPASSWIHWIAGAFYYNDKSGYDPLIAQSSAATLFNRTSYMSTQSEAGFGQVDIPVFSKVTVTAGLRYTSDSRSLNASDLGTTPTTPKNVVQDTEQDDKLTYRAAITYQIANDATAYVSASRGFKSGLFNTTTPSQPVVKPETLDAYEVGFKSEIFEHRLRLNGSVFHYNFTDIQTTGTTPAGSLLLNAAAAKSNGAELQVQAVPIRDLQLGASVQYLDMYFTSFSNAPGFIPQPGGASTPITVDAAGNQSPFAPKWTATLTGAYSFRTPTGTYTIGGNYYYDHGYYFDAQNRTSQNPYSLAGAYSEWTSHDDRFSIQLWAKNLGDRRYNTIVNPQNFGDTTTPASPRTYGITARLRLQ